MRDLLLEWGETLQKNLITRETKTEVVGLIENRRERVTNILTKFLAAFDDPTKYTDFRDSKRRLYIWEENWLFMKMLRNFRQALPCHGGVMEGKGRDTSFSQTTGLASNKTILMWDYFVGNGVIDKKKVPTDLTFVDVLDQTVREKNDIDAWQKQATITLLAFANNTCNVGEGMHVLRGKK